MIVNLTPENKRVPVAALALGTDPANWKKTHIAPADTRRALAACTPG